MSFYRKSQSRKLVTDPRNWESGIRDVTVEACDKKEDPLGFRAIFLFDQQKAEQEQKKAFVIGASFLAKREVNLKKAGYAAPMTHKAIALIEEKMGQSPPIVLA